MKRQGNTSFYQGAFSRFLKNRLAVAGSIVITLFLFCMLFPSVVAPYGFDEQNLGEQFLAPSAKHIFGTDDFGRDIFSRVIYGCRISLSIGLSSVAFASSLGVLLGCVAGYYGSSVDNIIMRLMDILMAIPSILLAISIVATLGNGFQNMIAAIAFSSVPPYARIVRSLVLTIKKREFVSAAKSNGSGDWWIISRHILPNCFAPIIVQATTNIATAILAASSLSFIGLGIVPPTPEWGAMLAAGRSYFRDYWYIVTFPGLAIMMSVLAFNLFGDGLRDALDPKLK